MSTRRKIVLDPRSQDGSSALILAFLMTTIIGLVAFLMNNRSNTMSANSFRNIEQQQLERVADSALVSTSSLMKAVTSGCSYYGFGNCPYISPSQAFCIDKFPTTGLTPYAQGWVQWAKGALNKKLSLIQVRQPALGDNMNWSMDTDSKGSRLKIMFPYVGSRLTDKQVDSLFSQGLATGNNPISQSADDVAKCYSNALNSYLSNLTASGYSSYISHMNSCVSLPANKKIDSPDADEVLTQVTFDRPYCPKGVLTAWDVTATILATPPKKVGFEDLSAVAKTIKRSARITIPPPGASALCSITAPDEAKNGASINFGVTVWGGASGVSAPGGIVYLYQQPYDPPVAAYTGSTSVNFGALPNYKTTITAITYDLQLKQAGSCSKTIYRVGAPIPGPTCKLTASLVTGGCVSVAQVSTGEISKEYPPPLMSCQLVPNTTYTFSGLVEGRGGKSQCTASITTAPPPPPPPPPPPNSGGTSAAPIAKPENVTYGSSPTSTSKDPTPPAKPPSTACNGAGEDKVVDSFAGTDSIGDYVCNTIRTDKPCTDSTYKQQKVYTDPAKVVNSCD